MLWGNNDYCVVCNFPIFELSYLRNKSHLFSLLKYRKQYKDRLEGFLNSFEIKDVPNAFQKDILFSKSIFIHVDIQYK